MTQSPSMPAPSMPPVSMPVPSTLADHERRFQAVVVGGLVTVFAIVALAPHTERALFEEGRLPSAFAAVVTAPVAPLLRRFGTMEPETFARAFRTGRPTPALPATRTVLPGLIPPAAVDQPPVFLVPADDVAPPPVAEAGVPGIQSNPGGLLPAFLTPGGGSGIIGTGVVPGGADPIGTGPIGTGPIGTGPAGPNPPSGPADPVSPVPEPASWMMILSGMALIGVVVRRARGRAGAIV